VTAGPRGPTAGRDVAGPPAPDPIFTTELACVYCGKRVSLECWSGEHHMARTRMDGAAVPAPPAGLTVETLAALLAESPLRVPLDGWEWDEPTPEAATWPEHLAAWLAPRLPGSPGAAARRAPTDAMIDAAQALVVKLDECAPHITSAFLLQQVHGGQYTGPTYAAELGALRAALAATSRP